jgi:5-methyltetrahydropteroyltriglutamate--homocysteine methyltransferase
MMSSNIITTHTLGFPSIGVKRELKKALEAYWNGHSSAETLDHAELVICPG